jgi:hypothetical protein
VAQQIAVRSFDALREADLQEVYNQTKQEALREYAFRLKLNSADSLEKLKQLVFDDAATLDRCTARALLEISNRFRLFDAPEYEIRLYEETRNTEFRAIPRAREFYLLALNKVGRTAETVVECRRLIAEGAENGLVWGILGNSYSIRMLCAEKFAAALEVAAKDVSLVDASVKADFLRQFPNLEVQKLTLDQARSLRGQLLDEATQAYRSGFERCGTAFPGLCLMIRTLDKYTDLLAEQALLLGTQNERHPDVQSKASLRRIEAWISSLERHLAALPVLLRVALELEGGRESLDFWPHSGELQLAFSRGCDMMEISPILARVFATLDAEFKLNILSNDLTRIRDQHARMLEITRSQGGKIEGQEQVLDRMGKVLADLAAGHDRFVAGGKTRGSALNEFYTGLAEAVPTAAEAIFLKRTINFHALINNLVPQYVPGGIGRVGARVPDLTVNRNVQEDLRAIISENVLPSLPPGEQDQPRKVIAVIQNLIGQWLGLSDLQDLQSPAHQAFDARSDGLILLSGIDPAMRIGSRSTTDLTAALLLRTGDCRETMYLNGALYACYQHIQVLAKLREAIERLNAADMENLYRITGKEIPAILRYQLRGGHVSVYVEGIAMRHKYHVERFSEDDPTAVEREYGIAEIRAGKPLRRYELDNSKIRVSYLDGTVVVLEPRDPVTGKWRPLEHDPVPEGGGFPRVPETGVLGGGIAGIQLLNLVEEHTMSFLFDGETGDVELCDGFYNERLYDSPYQFGSGCLETMDILKQHELIRTGTRAVRGSDGRIRNRQVFIEFLPYSTTDHMPALGEGDLPCVFQLMGRLFEGKLREERQRLEDGTSGIPMVLEKVQAWHLMLGSAVRQPQALDERFVRVLIELARDRPELVTLQDVKRDRPLLIQGHESDSVYLLLSGEFEVYQNGKLIERSGRPVIPPPGSVLGEISALRGCLPTATVVGDGVVLRISKAEFLRQLDINSVFRDSVEELVKMRLERDQIRRE